MNEADARIEADAVAFIKSNKQMVLDRFCPPHICHPVQHPISLFMAGSPGAGKTEVSKSLVKEFKDVPIRIDADEIRVLCPGYVGTNAHLFQKAANKGVNILYDYARQHYINCIMDGTFAYGGAAENITRSLERDRRVEIWFVYQDPMHAWEATKAREARETRRILKSTFIKAFFESRHNAQIVKKQFGERVQLNLLVKDYETGVEDFYFNVQADELDRIADDRYSEDTLDTLLI